MNKQKENKTMTVTELSKRVCPRAKVQPSKGSTESAERKHTVHSGIKFKGDVKKKLTVVKPFSFDTGPKKGTRCPLREKSPENRMNGELKHKVSGTSPDESIKISKTTRSSSKPRSASGERKPKSPVNDAPREKKPCNRSSKAAKPQAPPPKSENHPSPSKTLTSHTASSQGKISKTAKAEVHFSKEEKTSTTRSSHSSSVGKSKSEIPKPSKPILNIKNAEVNAAELTSLLETKLKCDAPPLNELTILEIDSSEGTTPEFESPNGIILEYKHQNTTTKVVESSVSKNVSKIPRKKCSSPSGLNTNLKEETVKEQSFTFENRCLNVKKENIHVEANQMQITNVVNN